MEDPLTTMEYLSWPDNTCSVGYTCIHGWMNADEMKYLEGAVTGGHFTPTYYREGCSVRHSRDHGNVYGEQRKGYYFTFPLLLNLEFLIILRMHGLIPNKGQENEGGLKFGRCLKDHLTTER